MIAPEALTIGAHLSALSKHAAIAFAEWLAIQHGDAGVRVLVHCPQAVDTPMIAHRSGSAAAAADGVISPAALADCVISPAALADCVVAGIESEAFLIMPHPQVKWIRISGHRFKLCADHESEKK